jgi:hypothetical protein
MQATVREFDLATRSGTVFCDDGTVVAFGPGAFAASGLRLLRPGQRQGGDGAVAVAADRHPLPGPRAAGSPAGPPAAPPAGPASR